MMSVLSLDLRGPLFYKGREDVEPFGDNPADGEFLFCFELNPSQCLCFEPGEPYLGPLVFKGELATEAESGADGFRLERGSYLFAQTRETLTREGWLAMAVEVQQEGLWRRLTPGPRLYLRRLWEDGRPVTQAWRPVSGG
ncbi:MAG: hypothetical protein LBL19_05795 [Spirochaetaceae bacterium]|jgi:hypothetical protein|nr:hypothetical protein [Spirochaetaceae bacterium]